MSTVGSVTRRIAVTWLSLDVFLTFFRALLAYQAERYAIRKRFYQRLKHNRRVRMGKVTH